MTLKAVGWLTGICLCMLTGRVIYVYLEWLWRTRQMHPCPEVLTDNP
jgi:hypothetical protein